MTSTRTGARTWSRTRRDGKLRFFPGRRTSLGTPQVLPVSMTGVDAILGGGDYTADGGPDLVLRHGDTGTIEVLPGTGTGSVSHALGPFRSLRGWHAVSGGQLIGNAERRRDRGARRQARDHHRERPDERVRTGHQQPDAARRRPG